MTLADRIAAQGRIGPQSARAPARTCSRSSSSRKRGASPSGHQPENLRVRPRRGDRSLHLVLFDFSWPAPPTPASPPGPRLPRPFLSQRPGKRWDPAADRFAAAATLPRDGHRHPPGVGATAGPIDPRRRGHPRLDPELFDPAVRDGLTAFFARALHQDADKRFGGMEEMPGKWRNVFGVGARRRPPPTEDRAAGGETLDRLADAADEHTSVVDLGLSGGGSGALERISIGTARQLVDHPLASWPRCRASGSRPSARSSARSPGSARSTPR